MGERGPAPKPRPLKYVEGRSEGRDSGGRKLADVPRFIRQAPAMPDGLPPNAVAMWEQVVPELEGLDLLKRADQGVVTAFCLMWDQVLGFLELYKNRPLLVVSKRSGAIKPNPAAAGARAAAREMLLFAREMGCTPSAEQRLSSAFADVADDDNPYAGAGPRGRLRVVDDE